MHRQVPPTIAPGGQEGLNCNYIARMEHTHIQLNLQLNIEISIIIILVSGSWVTMSAPVTKSVSQQEQQTVFKG